MPQQIDRRSFLVSVAATGGTLTLGFDIPFGPPRAHAANDAPEITAWIMIQPDDAIIIRVAKSEMGQGAFTALPMLVAEELECDWRKVKAEFAAPEENLKRNRVWGDMATGSSRSVRTSHELLRKAGAVAREMLIDAAAATLDVPDYECIAANGVITHGPSGRSVRFGEVAEAAAGFEPPKDITLKEPGEWTIIGKPTKRLEIIDKVMGKPIYGIDVRLPGLLHAALMQSPAFKGTLQDADESKISRMSGVRKVVKMRDAVAVVADTWWQAKKALAALPVTWDDGDNGALSSDGIDDYLRAGLTAADVTVGRRQGDVGAGFAQSARLIEAEYAVPFLAHATMEPQNCTAHVTADKVELWVPTQNGEASLAAAAQAAGVRPRNVVVHKTMLGGGFGRRGAMQDFVPHAVLIAKEVGQPVKTVWTREEDMRHDFYRPAAVARMMAGLDAAGMPIAWHVRLAAPSTLSLTGHRIPGVVDIQVQESFTGDMPYDVEHYLVDHATRNTPVPVGFWRSVSHSHNAFFKECFVDEMAQAAGYDPYQFRRRLIGNHPDAAKYLSVLDAVASKAGWGSPLPDGVHRGIALNSQSGSFTAAVIEASIGDDGTVRVQRVVCAIDCGHVVNPLTIEAQVEGAVVFGLTAALYGEITINEGQVEQTNFDDYPMIRMADTPKIETIVMGSGGFWGGVGEPPTAIVAPALCNAIFAATGTRVRTLPLKNYDFRKA